ncbi:MAG: hypothetical protein Tsb0021_15640 [Chlamydiales bacterium]
MESEIRKLKNCKEWNALTEKYSPSEVLQYFDFKEAVRFADTILNSDPRNDALLSWGIKFLFLIKNKFPQEWNKDWMLSAYLSFWCELAYMYLESYKILKEAVDFSEDPSPTLLYLFGHCCKFPPEIDLMSEEERAKWFKQSLSKQVTYEAAHALSFVTENRNLKEYWKSVSEEAEITHSHIESIGPKILEEI